MNKLFFSKDHYMIRDMCRDFAQNEITPVAKKLDETEAFPKELVKQMGELGIMGINVPEKYGGTGLDMVSFATAIIELARADASVAITMAAHASLGTLPVLLFGDEKQKERYLPGLASGETLGAFGLTEPQAGSDAVATKTKAVLKKLAKKVRIHGECGGYMVLGKAIIDQKGKYHSMFGLLSLITSFEKRNCLLYTSPSPRD